MRRISCKLFAEGCEKAVSRCLKLAKGTGILPLKQTWEPTGRMPTKLDQQGLVQGKFHYTWRLLQTLQVLMCLSWSQAFRSTLGTWCKLHMLAAANATSDSASVSSCLYKHLFSLSSSLNLSLYLIVFWDPKNTNPNHFPPSCCITGCNFAPHCLKWLKWSSSMYTLSMSDQS